MAVEAIKDPQILVDIMAELRERKDQAQVVGTYSEFDRYLIERDYGLNHFNRTVDSPEQVIEQANIVCVPTFPVDLRANPKQLDQWLSGLISLPPHITRGSEISGRNSHLDGARFATGNGLNLGWIAYREAVGNCQVGEYTEFEGVDPAILARAQKSGLTKRPRLSKPAFFDVVLRAYPTQEIAQEALRFAGSPHVHGLISEYRLNSHLIPTIGMEGNEYYLRLPQLVKRY